MSANRIRELRKKRNMSQVRLSIELSVSQETISSYENGKYMPSFATLEKLASLFGVSIDYLMGRDDTADEKIPQLTSDEKDFLNMYRELSSTKKERLIAYLQGLSEN